MTNTTPVFILGSGRSGTYALAQAFRKSANAESHHEYLFENVLADAVLYHMGRLSESEILARLRETHVAAVHYCQKPIWIDCSNALPWLVRPLLTLFPDAKFVHVVRNGRRVVSSFFNKFDDVMYADASVNTLKNWLAGKSTVKPPPEKKYWRPMPDVHAEGHDEFLRMDRFARLCYYWTESNRTVADVIEAEPSARARLVKFEDLKRPELFAGIADFIGLQEIEAVFAAMARPINVAVPQTFELTPEQDAMFVNHCGPTMERFGYTAYEDYKVDYNPSV